MKHIWCIDKDKFILNEGYVVDNYKDYKCIRVWIEEKINKILDIYEVEYIFDNKETAINILKGMIKIQMTKLQKHIDDCIRKREELFEKLIETI